MRFMMLVIPGDPKAYLAGAMPDPGLVEKMMKYNEELQRSGSLLALDGLHSPASGHRIRFQGGKATVTDGPFSEAKEVIGGYWLIQCKSKEEALAWATRAPMEEGATIELRQVHDVEDFPPEVRALTEDFAAKRA